jgi:hypothetical protein
MGNSRRQQEQIAGVQNGELLLTFFVHMKELKLAFELIEYFVAGIDVKIFAPVRTAGDEGDEVRILPDHPTLAPVTAVLIDPLLEIKTFKVGKHNASFCRS